MLMIAWYFASSDATYVRDLPWRSLDEHIGGYGVARRARRRLIRCRRCIPRSEETFQPPYPSGVWMG